MAELIQTPHPAGQPVNTIDRRGRVWSAATFLPPDYDPAQPQQPDPGLCAAGALKAPCNRNTGDGPNHYIASRSVHPGGVNVLLGDGSIRFIKDSIALPTWKALSSRSGGEVISGDAF